MVADGGYEQVIGIVAPNKGRIHEEEYPEALPPEFATFIAPLRVTEVTPEGIEEITPEIESAARLLADAGADMILVSGTPVFMVAGLGFDRELIDRLEGETGLPTTTMMTAIVDAIGELDMEEIVVVTPYTDEMDPLLADYLEGSGISVREIRNLGLGTADPDAYNEQGPEASYDLAADCLTDHPDVDGCLISCGGFRTFGSIPKLEAEFGVPVTSSGHASLWASLRLLGYDEPLEGYGRLLEGHLAPSA